MNLALSVSPHIHHLLGFRFESLVISRRNADEDAEFGCEHSRHDHALSSVLSKQGKVMQPPVVMELRTASRGASEACADILLHTTCDRVEGLAITNERGKIRAKCIGKVVNPIQDRNRGRSQVCQRFRQCSLECRKINHGGSALEPHGLIQQAPNHVEARGKRTDFGHKQTTKHPRISFPKRNHFIVLLLGNPFRLLSNLCCFFRSSIRSDRDIHSRSGGSKAHSNSRPVGHVPPINCERAYRHRTPPLSMLEPILP